MVLMCHFLWKSETFLLFTQQLLLFVGGRALDGQFSSQRFQDCSHWLRVLPMDGPHSRPSHGPQIIMMRCWDLLFRKVHKISIGSLDDDNGRN